MGVIQVAEQLEGVQWQNKLLPMAMMSPVAALQSAASSHCPDSSESIKNQ